MDKEMIRDYELDIIVKAWRDESFRQNLLKDPKKAIKNEFDIDVPDEVSVSVHEESEDNIHLIVPSVPPNFSTQEFSDDELRDVIGGVIATGHLSAFPSSKAQKKVQTLKRENEQQRKMIEKLKNDLLDLEKQILKSK